MTESKLHTIRYPNGEIQRIQAVFLDGWEQTEFYNPPYSERSFPLLCDLYQNYIIPRCPWIFGQLVLFRLPEDLVPPFPKRSNRYGTVADSLTATAISFRQSVTIIGKQPVFSDRTVRSFWKELEERDCVRIISGFLPHTTILPVRNSCGFLSAGEAELCKVNSSFFTMDRFDCASVYDAIGTTLGLQVRDGFVLNPPLYEREALFVRKDGAVSVQIPKLSDLSIEIGPMKLRPGDNASVYVRPAFRKSPVHTGIDLVVIGNRVAAVHPSGNTSVPSSGFVLAVEASRTVSPGDPVVYRGFENVSFAVQAGNSIVIDGTKTTSFRSPFYNIRKLWSTSYPPSLYPLNYERDRAPRIALGEDRAHRPMLVWAEGPGKLRYRPGEDSCGASLSEMADICVSLDMKNGVNLDGGGSAQILLNGHRSLRLSDRNPDDSEAERAIPSAIRIR